MSTGHDDNRHDNGHDDREDREEVENVVYLPGHDRADDTADPGDSEVLDGEIVTEDEYRELTTQREKALDRWRGYREDAQTVGKGLVKAGRGAHTVATHRHTQTVGKAALRHALYVPAGAFVVGKRLWEAKTNSRYERMLRAAEAAGDWEKLADWETRSEQARERRHKRRMDWIAAPAQLAKALAIGVATLVGALLGLGILLAIATSDASMILGPIEGVIQVIQWIVIAVTVVWGPLVLAAPWLGLITLWWLGKRAGMAPDWLQSATTDTGEVVVDERSIARALAHLGIKAVNDYFKAGGVLAYTAIPHRDGLGVAAQVRMPTGSTAADVIRQKDRLAANLGRAAVETWPSTGADEGLLDVWIANRGALDTGGGPWPWLETRKPVNVFEGVPVGTTLRGDEVIGPMDGATYLIGGRPGQGKSTFGELLVAGACLDPHAEVWCHVLADNADFDPLTRRFARYQVGMGNEVAAAALQAFKDLLAEMEHRGQVMRSKGVDTAARAGFHPLVAIFDEVHRLFQHREYGAEAGQVAEDVIKQARKYGIILILLTQSPTATSIPKGVTREVICRVAFSVIDQPGNDALLGDGHYKRGVRATELRPGSEHSPGDRGKALTVGVVPGTDWSMLLAHRLDKHQLAAVAKQAMTLLAGRDVPGSERDTAPAAVADPLADIAAVMGGHARMRTQELLQRLAERDHASYDAWTFARLSEYLARYGAEPYKTGGHMQVSTDRITAALTHREQQRSGEGEGGD